MRAKTDHPSMIGTQTRTRLELVVCDGCKGGMGEVYRATDTRLHRSVAIKTSKREFNDRFEREAPAIAAINHPNICTLYDISPDYLVMEFVEGELLSKLLERGPLAIDNQIADALIAAHAKGRGPSRSETRQHHHHFRRG
jgi:serine/threonine protein kinase